MPRQDRSRAALLGTAALLFRRQGYAATGVNQILKTAHVKAGSLYHHFPNGKQELAAAVVDSAGGDIERLLRRFMDSDLAVADIVDSWIDLLAVQLASDRRDGCPIEPIATEAVNASPRGLERGGRRPAARRRLARRGGPPNGARGDLADRGGADLVAHRR
jgi:TetR/AcrR family transcriptional repressor of lmrAB and yxaGH operons